MKPEILDIDRATGAHTPPAGPDNSRDTHRRHSTGAGFERDGAETRKSGPLVIVAGAIAPYTNRLYNACAREFDIDLRVLVCAGVEPQRKWRMPVAETYQIDVLPGLRMHRSDLQNIYINPAVVARLRRIKPAAVLLGGFSPTMMLAAGHATVTRTPLGVMTDGSVDMDPGRTSRLHRWMRRMVVPRACVGVGASENSIRLLESYGLRQERGIVVPITAPWPAPACVPGYEDRAFDVLFCGALEDARKGAGFFADVVIAARAAGLNLRVRVAGDGPLRSRMRERFDAADIEAHFDGYVQPDQLAEIYGSARLFLFPSRGDPWGLVANEAMQCGTPVLCSPHAVSSHELIVPYGGGQMIPLDVLTWRTAVTDALTRPESWQHMHAARRRAEQRLSLDTSVRRFGEALSVLGVRSAADQPASPDR